MHKLILNFGHSLTLVLQCTCILHGEPSLISYSLPFLAEVIKASWKMWHMECLAASRSCSIHKLIFEVRAYYISLKAICVARSSLISYSLPFLNGIKGPDIFYPHNLDDEAKFQYPWCYTFFRRRLFTGFCATNSNKLLWIPPEPNCLNPNT